MTSHSAVRDSVVEMCRRTARYNLDVAEMKTLMEYVERSQAGEEFTTVVRNILAPISQHISTKNVDEICRVYPEFPLKTVVGKIPDSEQATIWQALGMTNMLLTTLQMVPTDMLSKIESMTSVMMGAMQQGGGLNDLFKNMGSIMGDLEDNNDDGDDDDEEVTPSRPLEGKNKGKNKGKKSKQEEFRDKLC